jgi:hypothetical protein
VRQPSLTGKRVAVFSARTEAWDMALQYYSLLQRRALNDAELTTALEPVTQFFAYRHPSVKPPVGSPTRRQRKAVAKATRTLKKVAGGKLAAPGASTPSTPRNAAGTNGGEHG